MTKLLIELIVNKISMFPLIYCIRIPSHRYLSVYRGKFSKAFLILRNKRLLTIFLEAIKTKIEVILLCSIGYMTTSKKKTCVSITMKFVILLFIKKHKKHIRKIRINSIKTRIVFIFILLFN